MESVTAPTVPAQGPPGAEQGPAQAAPLEQSGSFAIAAVHDEIRAYPAVADDDQVRSVIAATIRTHVGIPVDVALTHNRRTMISAARRGGSLELRLHRMFADADASILDAIGRYVQTGDRRASRRLGEYIEAKRSHYVAARPPRALRALGAHHDLDGIFAELERRFFAGALGGVAITWGKRGAARRGRRRKRTIRLGTYTHDERLIRVHPALDQEWVPRFFVEYIVFHEMLHHVEPAREEAGRTCFHTPEFKSREKAYPEYQRALAWERANLTKLLAS